MPEPTGEIIEASQPPAEDPTTDNIRRDLLSNANFSEINKIFNDKNPRDLAAYLFPEESSDQQDKDFDKLRKEITVENIPSTSFESLKGVEGPVRELRQIADRIIHPEEAAEMGLPDAPHGAILYGEPGTGKTSLARALVNEIKANTPEGKTVTVLRVNVSHIFQKWVGESGKAISGVLQIAREAQKNGPVIIIMDEIDALFPKPGENVHEVTNQVLAVFKEGLEGLDTGDNQYTIIGMSNRKLNIPDELVSRIGTMIEVPPPPSEYYPDIMREQVKEREEKSGGRRIFEESVDYELICKEIRKSLTGKLVGRDIARIVEKLASWRFSRWKEHGRSKEYLRPLTQDEILKQIQDPTGPIQEIIKRVNESSSNGTQQQDQQPAAYHDTGSTFFGVEQAKKAA